MICTILRKPLNGGGVIANLPCGGIQIDACRVGTSKAIPGGLSKRDSQVIYQGGYKPDSRDNSGWNPNIGRFPANLIIRSDPSLLQWFLSEFGLTQEGVAVRVNGVSGSIHVLGGMGNKVPGTPNSPKYGTTPGSVSRYFKHCEVT